MKLTVIGSSSKGNCYALQSSKETLVLEAGCKASSFKKVLNYDYKPIVGIVVSHEHGDHCKYLKEFARTGAVIAAPEPVITRYGNPDYDITLVDGRTRSVGEFRVTPFRVYHDVLTFGYVIYHKEMGSLVFATDTYALPYEFNNVDHWLIEANYSDLMLLDARRNGTLDKHQYERILTSHMSLQNCIRNLELSDAANHARTVTLIHLSSRHSNPKEFRAMVAASVGAPCYIATKGTEVNLSEIL